MSHEIDTVKRLKHQLTVFFANNQTEALTALCRLPYFRNPSCRRLIDALLMVSAPALQPHIPFQLIRFHRVRSKADLHQVRLQMIA